MWDEVRAPPGEQHSVSLRAIRARQLQALVRQRLVHQLRGFGGFAGSHGSGRRAGSHGSGGFGLGGLGSLIGVGLGLRLGIALISPPLPNGSRLSCGRLARRRKGGGRQPVSRQGHNTPFPLERSSPASFKRLLGGLGGTIEEVYHTRPQTVLGTDHQ